MSTPESDHVGDVGARVQGRRCMVPAGGIPRHPVVSGGASPGWLEVPTQVLVAFAAAVLVLASGRVLWSAAASMPSASVFGPTQLGVPDFSWKLFLLVAAGLIGLLTWNHGWAALRFHPWERILLVAAAGPLCWTILTQPANPLFDDQMRWLPRIAALALFGILVWRPWAVLPFGVIAYLLLAEELFPLGQADGWSDRALNFGLIFVGAALVIIRSAAHTVASLPWCQDRSQRMETGRWSLRTLFSSPSARGAVRASMHWVLLITVAAFYFAPGVEKVRQGWLSGEEDLGLLVKGHWVRGWSSGWNPDLYSQVLSLLEIVGPIFIVLTLAVELGAVLIVFRWPATFLVASWICLNSAVFAVTGLAFWKWTVVNVVLLTLLLLGKLDFRLMFPTRAIRLAAIGAGLVAWLILGAPRLGWVDGESIETYQVRARVSTGQAVVVDAEKFGRHYMAFESNRFGYLERGDNADTKQERAQFDGLITAYFEDCAFSSGVYPFGSELALRHFQTWPHDYFLALSGVETVEIWAQTWDLSADVPTVGEEHLVRSVEVCRG